LLKHKETAAKIMTAIRHTKQRQILIGQTAEVGSNGWKWDDMKQCSLLVLGESIGTLCKHLVKDLGWTLKKSNEVKKQYEKFSDWTNKKNDSNPDLPPENITRIGLLITGSKFQFLELPIPHKGIIRSERVRSSLSINTQNQLSTNNIDTAKVEVKKVFVVPEIKCHNCGSTEFTRHRKKPDPTMHGYLCKSCRKEFTSYNNKPVNSN
jgi:DNA-directed RNA polymerase subunit RPC12/RpoP